MSIGDLILRIKRNILFFIITLFIFPLFCNENNTDIFLENYFNGREYNIKTFQFQNRTLIFSFYSKDSNDVIQKAIFFEEKDESIKPLFYVMDNKIFNSRKRLISPIIKTQKFYGWKVTPMFTENSISIYTLFYTDDGFHVTEGVTLVYMDGVFEKFVPIGAEY